MSQVSDRHGICRGDAFWKLNWVKYQLCMKGWSWASRGVPWLALGFHGLAQVPVMSWQQQHGVWGILSIIPQRAPNTTLTHLPLSALCLPLNIFGFFFLFMPSPPPMEDLFFLPVISTGQPQSLLPFQPSSPRLCQNFWNVPTLECTPQ